MVDESTIHAHLYGSRRDAAASFQNRNRKLIVEVERDLGSVFQVLLWSILYGTSRDGSLKRIPGSEKVVPEAADRLMGDRLDAIEGIWNSE
jgi:hypothetical protein